MQWDRVLSRKTYYPQRLETSKSINWLERINQVGRFWSWKGFRYTNQSLYPWGNNLFLISNFLGHFLIIILSSSPIFLKFQLILVFYPIFLILGCYFVVQMSRSFTRWKTLFMWNWYLEHWMYFCRNVKQKTNFSRGFGDWWNI